MSSAEEALFESREIKQLGMSHEYEFNTLIQSVQFAEQVAKGYLGTRYETAARKHKIQTPEFTGDIEFSRWLKLFGQDASANGWDEADCLVALQLNVGNGPGGVALTDWNCNSNGTYMSLIRKLAVACGADDCETCWRRVDQMRQVKGETTKNWGLRVMVREAAAYDRLPEQMIMRKINSVFLNGLRDAILRDRLTYEYKHTVHSISDLFKVAEQYNHSEHMFASGEITPQRDSYVMRLPI